MAKPIVNVTFDIPDHEVDAAIESLNAHLGEWDPDDLPSFIQCFVNEAIGRDLEEDEDFHVLGFETIHTAPKAVSTMMLTYDRFRSEGAAIEEARYITVPSITPAMFIFEELVDSLVEFIAEISAEEVAVERNDSPSDDQLARYSGDLERLIGVAHNLLQDGVWEDDPVAELDVQNTLDSLRAENERLDGSDRLIVERYSTRLSKAVIEHEISVADEKQKEALENLNTAVLDVVDSLDGTSGDGEKLRPAVEALAGNLAWSEIKAPDSVEAEEWGEFIEFAEANPVETLETAFGWRHRADFATAKTKGKYLPLSLGEAAGLTSATTLAIAAGLGFGGVPTLAIAPIVAVVGMVVRTFAVNFKRAAPSSEPED